MKTLNLFALVVTTSVVLGQTTTPSTPAGDVTTPFYQDPSTFTPPATGPNPGPGALTTVTANINGTYPVTFSYSVPSETVSATGNATIKTASPTALDASPQNLQTASARADRIMPFALSIPAILAVML